MYVLINRQAPIPPPKRHIVRRLYDEYDTNHNNHISREEFKFLSRRICQRAISRIVIHKVTTLIGAPIVAEFTYRRLKHVEAIPRIANKIPLVSQRMANSPTFGRTILLVAYVTTLGNVVTKSFTYILQQHTATSKQEER